jgi:hypothetical protein
VELPKPNMSVQLAAPAGPLLLQGKYRQALRSAARATAATLLIKFVPATAAVAVVTAGATAKAGTAREAAVD